MTHTDWPELIGSILTFFGGLLLVIDAFSPVRGLYLEGGEKKWQWVESQLQLRGEKPAETEPPPNDPQGLQHAKRSQCLTRGGFGLVLLGFLFDLLGKLHWL